MLVLCPAGLFAAPGVAGDPLAALPVTTPISASLGGILAPTTVWRSPGFEVYRWDRFPDIVVIDTVGFAEQDRLFTRLAYFAEKRGYRGRLLTNATLAGRHGWNAHDYGGPALASFYSAVEASGFALNPEEIDLRRLALSQGIIVEHGDGYASGRGGVLGITRGSSTIERRLLLTHESFHGIFFSSDEYRDFCFRLWDSLPRKERSFYTTFLDSLGYDGDDEYLAVNEFQAYLMQQPLDMAASYFQRFIDRFAEEGAPVSVTAKSLVATARKLDDFLGAAFDLHAGETR